MSSPVAASGPQALSMRALGLLVTGYEKVSGISGRFRPEVVPVDRDRCLIVADVTDEADEVVGLRLVPESGELPFWQPGAHIDVALPSGIVRQYSLCGDPTRIDEYRIAVRRIAGGGGGSREVHTLRAGDLLTVRGPRHAFPFLATDRYLFVAGGIGVTPIRPMIHDAVRRGVDWQFVYTGRTRASMPFVDELTALDPARVHIWPDEQFGVPTGAKIIEHAPKGAALYCCGPAPMIAGIRAQIPAPSIDTLHFERFSPPRVIGGAPFEMVLARSGKVIAVDRHLTALAAICAQLPSVPYSCQQGFCGTCPVRVIDGRIEHRDRCLTDAQREQRMAICVSRGIGRITLDL
ncbi:MAG: PDR/VanB family oxidoreductase [Jatrophihabitantaceae bacterium]